MPMGPPRQQRWPLQWTEGSRMGAGARAPAWPHPCPHPRPRAPAPPPSLPPGVSLLSGTAKPPQPQRAKGPHLPLSRGCGDAGLGPPPAPAGAGEHRGVRGWGEVPQPPQGIQLMLRDPLCRACSELPRPRPAALGQGGGCPRALSASARNSSFPLHRIRLGFPR